MASYVDLVGNHRLGECNNHTSLQYVQRSHHTDWRIKTLGSGKRNESVDLALLLADFYIFCERFVVTKMY